MTCWLIPLTIIMVLYGFISEHFGDHIKAFFSSILHSYIGIWPQKTTHVEKAETDKVG